MHRGRVEQGLIAVNDRVSAEVDLLRRADIARNHTGTHLLHAALRRVLGPHVQQAGSLVAPDRLRFDFSHIAPMTPEQIGEVQRLVNECVRADWQVQPHEESYEEALAHGALAFFDEKYGDRVRVVEVRAAANGRPHARATIAGDDVFSKELCGGTHCGTTGEIGLVYIVGESSIGAGIRRIEAVTGRAAEELLGQRMSMVDEVSRRVGAAPADLPDRIEGLLDTLEQERKRVQELQRDLARRQVDELMGRVQRVNGFSLVLGRVAAGDFPTLREMADQLRNRLGSGVVVLGAVFDDRPNFLAAVTKDLTVRGVHAGSLVKAVAAITGGSGGGRPELAQAGGRDASKLQEALQRVPVLLEEQAAAR